MHLLSVMATQKGFKALKTKPGWLQNELRVVLRLSEKELERGKIQPASDVKAQPAARLAVKGQSLGAVRVVHAISQIASNCAGTNAESLPPYVKNVVQVSPWMHNSIFFALLSLCA